jgi:hypothetical protein
VFSGARLRRVTFEKCRFRDADFGGADLSGTSFVECELTSVELSGAKLDGVDIRTSTVKDVRVNARDVRGLVLEPAHRQGVREQRAVRLGHLPHRDLVRLALGRVRGREQRVHARRRCVVRVSRRGGVRGRRARAFLPAELHQRRVD